MAVQKRDIKDIGFVTIHHSAVPNDGRYPTLQAEAKQFDQWHSQRSWADGIKTPGERGYRYISYHFLVNEKGEHLNVQNIEYVRYHASDSGRGEQSHNLWGIGICMSGYFHPPYNNTPSDEQWKKVATLIYRLEKMIGKSLIVRGHRETSLTGTACPGDVVGNYNEKYMKKIVDYTNWLHKNGEPEEKPVEPDCSKLKEQLDESLEKNIKLDLDLRHALTRIGKEKEKYENLDKQYVTSIERVVKLEHDMELYLKQDDAVLKKTQAENDELKNTNVKLELEVERLRSKLEGKGFIEWLLSWPGFERQ